MRVLLILTMVLVVSGCSKQVDSQVIRVSGPTMGTSYSIAWVTRDPASEARVKQSAEQLLIDINRSMSTYDPESELSLLNQGRLQSDEQGWIALSENLVDVLAMSIFLHQASEGAFDVTVGPLVNLWGFGPQARPDHVPDADVISRTKTDIGTDALELDPMQQRLKLSRPVYIDLSAIAKGWAVDQLALLLEQQGISAYMVEIGGEIRTRGVKPDGNQWRIAIERPQSRPDDRQVALIIEPGELGIATSGDYRNYFEEDGVRFSHTIDPASGYPIRHTLASVSVVHESAGMADGWATALNVLGPERGMAIAEQYDLAVFMLVHEGGDFVTRTSPRFKQLFPHSAD